MKNILKLLASVGIFIAGIGVFVGVTYLLGLLIEIIFPNSWFLLRGGFPDTFAKGLLAMITVGLFLLAICVIGSIYSAITEDES